ncbi:hypothetical protein PGTUg99_010778 [Puccinia graminis f. sp. tritici]|uniref:Uncharacterized protein n=1 Tax=Puccinia graminis f. sp. tritici TaxID=56615 RepID=A0A5B0SAW0_PUCGR|nr:hypothetical protein PGTUg99_008906 [Puccinia graminis f. sp. tritici]KAA1134944.1 hypothetical protein PGTUg99_010778 [Puccinia graminis f. sp. tritici]
MEESMRRGVQLDFFASQHLLGDPLHARRGRFLLSGQLHGVVVPIHPAGPLLDQLACDLIKPNEVGCRINSIAVAFDCEILPKIVYLKTRSEPGRSAKR